MTTCVRSTLRCPRISSGTTTRSSTTGIPARCWIAPTTPRSEWTYWPRAFQAFHEWQPIDVKQAVDDGRVYRSSRYGRHVEIFVLDMRSYRDANTADPTRPGSILGERQARWLARGLSNSTATWKIVQSDMPIGLVIPDGEHIEGVANGLPGVPGGRDSELAWVLRTIARRKVANVVWLTADVHRTAAHDYSPDRAAVADFEPFWEFVSGPLNAGAFPASELDVRSRAGVHPSSGPAEHLPAGWFPALR